MKRDAPLDRLEREWPWHRAELLYRAGEPDSLAKLLRTRGAIPHAQRRFLADLVAGKIPKPKRRGKGNAILRSGERAQITDALASERDFREWATRNADTLADEFRVDVRDLLARLAAERATLIDALARRYGVKPATIVKAPQRFKPILPTRKRQ